MTALKHWGGEPRDADTATPPQNDHANATDAEQARARRALLTSGLSFIDQGWGFFVRGRFGCHMSPGEVLAIAEKGRLR